MSRGLSWAPRRRRGSSENELEVVRGAYEHALAQLNFHEMLWMSEWHSAPNPWIALERWLAPEAKARRAAVLEPFYAARDKYLELARAARGRSKAMEEA